MELSVNPKLLGAAKKVRGQRTMIRRFWAFESPAFLDIGGTPQVLG